jgi:hypothetical protein
MTSTAAALWTSRISGLVALLLGLLQWVGGGGGIVPLHMLAGVVLVAALVTLAGLGLRGGAGPALPAVAVGWAVFVLVFGLNHATILPGEMHVVVEVLHLLVGLAAVGIGEALGARIRRAAARG